MNVELAGHVAIPTLAAFKTGVRRDEVLPMSRQRSEYECVACLCTLPPVTPHRGMSDTFASAWDALGSRHQPQAFPDMSNPIVDAVTSVATGWV